MSKSSRSDVVSRSEEETERILGRIERTRLRNGRNCLARERIEEEVDDEDDERLGFLLPAVVVVGLELRKGENGLR